MRLKRFRKLILKKITLNNNIIKIQQNTRVLLFFVFFLVILQQCCKLGLIKVFKVIIMFPEELFVLFLHYPILKFKFIHSAVDSREQKKLTQRRMKQHDEPQSHD